MKSFTAVLTCTALAFAFAGCTSSSTPETGGIDAELTMNPGTTLQQEYLLVTVRIECTGDDPYNPGFDWDGETIFVNTTYTGPDDEGTNRPMFGLFKKEGLPAGECTVTIDAMSDDGSVTCKGEKAGIVVVPPENTFVDIRVSCVADTRHGGIGVDAEFNQCAEYEQIIVSPTSVSIPNPGDVDIWCRDLDGDSMLAAVQLVTLASTCNDVPLPANPDDCVSPTDPATEWVSCGEISGVSGPQFLPCADGGVLNETYTCDTAGACVVAIGMSDDSFAGALTGMPIPFGCDGTDDNASALIPVNCQSLSACGNGVVETPPEECDRNAPGAVPPTEPFYGTDGTSGTWCSTTCKKIADVCADTTTAPPSPDGCSQPADPCQQAGCDSTATVPGDICTGDENATGVIAGDVCGASTNYCGDTSGRGCSCAQAADECVNDTTGAIGALCPNGNQDCGAGETCTSPLLTCEVTPACTKANEATDCATSNECMIPFCDDTTDPSNPVCANIPKGLPGSSNYPNCTFTNPDPPGGTQPGLCVVGNCAPSSGECINTADLDLLLTGAEINPGLAGACSTIAALSDSSMCPPPFGTGADESGLNACLQSGATNPLPPGESYPGTLVTPECSNCTAGTSCCTLNFCSPFATPPGPCAGAPIPGDDCDLCIRANCQADFEMCSGLPYQ